MKFIACTASPTESPRAPKWTKAWDYSFQSGGRFCRKASTPSRA